MLKSRSTQRLAHLTIADHETLALHPPQGSGSLINKASAAKPTPLSDCFYLGLPKYQSSEEESGTL